MDDFELFYSGCSCTNSCEQCACSCLKFNVPNYVQGRLIESSASHDHPIFECNDRCQCPKSCSNRSAQLGIQIHLEIFCTDKKGFGLRAKEPILSNSFVCEYAGEVISITEARKRLENISSIDSNYILAVQEYYASKVNLTIIDPMFIGNVGRFINHSCDPNLRMEIVRVDTAVPKLCLFTNVMVQENEELSYDYAGFNKNGLQSDPLSEKECFCESTNCRKYLPRNDSVFNM